MYTKSFYKRGEVGDVIIIVVGIILALIALGFWRSPLQNVSFRESKQTSDGIYVDTGPVVVKPTSKCGLQIVSPEQNEAITDSLTVAGYINGCGWEYQNGFVGYVQVLDGTGAIVSNLETLEATSNVSTLPVSFEKAIALRQTPKGFAGLIVFYSMPNAQGGYVSEKLPIRFK